MLVALWHNIMSFSVKTEKKHQSVNQINSAEFSTMKLNFLSDETLMNIDK